MWSSRLAVLAALAAAPAGTAFAQTAPAPAPPAPTPVQSVTVTATTPDIRTSIDRRSYDLSKDLQTANGGSIADALRNLPSVDVDLNGNVSIRGDGHVQILVDGQPSGQFKGAGAGQILLTLPANQYERVEVMTNPSASVSPEGTGGIINLITRKNRKAGVSGGMRAAQGTRGRWSVGGSAAYKGDKLSATLDAGYRYDPQHSTDTDRRETFDPLGATTGTSDQLDVRQGALHIWYLRAGADYALDPKTQLSAEGHYTDFFYGVQAASDLKGFDAAGAPDLVFDRDGHVANESKTGGASATFRHSFAGDDHDLVVTLGEDRTSYNQSQIYTDLNLLPPRPDTFDNLQNAFVETTTDLKADYSRPMPWQAKLKAGYELKIDDFTGANDGFLQAATAAGPFDPGQSDRYHARRQIEALYATWEQPFGKLTALAGLRAETSRVDLTDASSQISDRTSAFRFYPSLHLSYQLDDAQQLIASYSQRVQRVVLDELDPFVFVDGPTSAHGGNPDLRDQETQVFEAGYQYKASAGTYIATLYYKDNQRAVTPVTVLEPDGVLLSTPQSLAHSTATGLELVASGHLTKTLSYNLSANYYRTELDGVLGFPGSRSGTTLSGRGSVTWQATDTDIFQISVRASGKQIIPQGFTELGPLVNLGYRHKLSDTLSLFVTAQDALASYRQETLLSSSAFRDEVHDRGRTPAAFIGFTYSFGAGAKKAEGFDYNN